MPSWNVLQAAATESASGLATSLAATFTTANLTAGTKIIAAYGFSSSTTSPVITTVRDGALNNLTQLGFLYDTTDVVGAALYAMDTPAGDVGTKPTITLTISSAGMHASALILEVEGLAAGNTLAMLDGGALAVSTHGSTSPMDSAAYSSTAAGEMLLAVFADNGGPMVIAEPWATLSPSSVNNNSFADILAAYKDTANTAEGGTGTRWSYSSGTQTQWATLLTAFRAAGGAPVTVNTQLAGSAGTAPAAVAAVTAAAPAAAAAGTAPAPSLVYGVATAGLYAAAAAAITGSWADTSNATGSVTGTYATWTDDVNGSTATLELKDFAAQAAVPAGSTVNSVTFTIRHGETPAARIASATAQAYPAGSPSGSPQALTVAAAVHDDTVTFSGLTWADLADLRVRVTLART